MKGFKPTQVGKECLLIFQLYTDISHLLVMFSTAGNPKSNAARRGHIRKGAKEGIQIDAGMEEVQMTFYICFVFMVFTFILLINRKI